MAFKKARIYKVFIICKKKYIELMHNNILLYKLFHIRNNSPFLIANQISNHKINYPPHLINTFNYYRFPI